MLTEQQQRTKWLNSLQVGDIVIRMLAGKIPIEMKVTARDEKYIHCGHWTFHPQTGAEVDEYLGWDGVEFTGSYIQPAKDEGTVSNF